MAPRFVTCVQPTYSLTHTHTDTQTHRHTENMHRPHQTTNQTSGIWGLAVARGALRQPGDTGKQRHQNRMLPLPWLEWMDQMKLKIRPGEESVCAVRGWMNARRVLQWMDTRCLEWLCVTCGNQRDLWMCVHCCTEGDQCASTLGWSRLRRWYSLSVISDGDFFLIRVSKLDREPNKWAFMVTERKTMEEDDQPGTVLHFSDTVLSFALVFVPCHIYLAKTWPYRQ